MKNLKTPVKKCLQLFFVPGALLLFLSSCLKDNNHYVNPPVAALAFVQASTDEPPLKFFLNSNLVNNLAPIQYGDNFSYINAYAGLRTASFDNASTMAQVLSDTIRLNQNVNYTLFLANTAANPQILLLTDTLNKPGQGNAAVRFVNVSPDSGPVDLQIKGASTTTIADKTFKGHSGFIPVTASQSFNLQVTKTGTSTVLATSTGVNLVAGGVYTIWFEGLTTSSNPADKPAIGIMTNTLFY